MEEVEHDHEKDEMNVAQEAYYVNESASKLVVVLPSTNQVEIVPATVVVVEIDDVPSTYVSPSPSLDRHP